MNTTGFIIGLATFIIIGIFHPLVIKGEYYFGVSIWWAFLIFGIAGVTASFFFTSVILSTLSGIIGFSCLWSIKEVFEQVKRVEEGRFPKNPKRMKRT